MLDVTDLKIYSHSEDEQLHFSLVETMKLTICSKKKKKKVVFTQNQEQVSLDVL